MTMAWQSVDGAMQGITAIIRKFVWVGIENMGRASNINLSGNHSARDNLIDRAQYCLMVSLRGHHVSV